MVRSDLPYALRGQKPTIFGNLERIYEFHLHKFLPELQRTTQTEMIGKPGIKF